MQVDATNKPGKWAHWNQSRGTTAELWSAARHYNVTLYCNSKGAPLLPRIVETESFSKPDYIMSLNRTYDLVISRHALNNGKLLSNESCLIIPQALQLLNFKGGTAMLHLLWDAFVPSKHSSYLIIRFFNFYSKNHQQNISIILYQTFCGYGAACINMLVRRCPPAAEHHRASGTCLIPLAGWTDAHMGNKPKTGVLDIMYDSLKHNLTKDKSRMYAYSLEYMQSLLGSLEAWKARGAIPILSKEQDLTCAQPKVQG